MEDNVSLLYQLGQACDGGMTFQKNTPSIIEEYDRKNELVLGAEVDRELSS